MPEGYPKSMTKKIIIFTLLSLYATIDCATAQPAKLERIGVIHMGGVLATVVDGLRAGLKDAGLQEDRQFALEIHDIKGDAKLAESVAQKFERDKFRLMFTATSPVTAAAMKGTKDISIVFAVGTDPVAQGFIKSFGQPGTRLTGIQYLVRDLTAKRLELLKELLPKLRQVVTFYKPDEPVSVESAKLGRTEAQRIGVKLLERHVKTAEELASALKSLKSGEFDAYLYVPDPLAVNQTQLIIDSARDKRLPTMFHDQILVTRGALASYGQSYFDIGWHSAKYVRQVLGGASPADLRVETIEDVELAFNLNTAKQIGVTIPPNALARAKKVIR